MEQHLHQRSQVIDDEEFIMNNKIVLEKVSDEAVIDIDAIEEGLKILKNKQRKYSLYRL